MKKYPVPYDFEEHRQHMRGLSRAMWKTFMREQKERNHE